MRPISAVEKDVKLCAPYSKSSIGLDGKSKFQGARILNLISDLESSRKTDDRKCFPFFKNFIRNIVKNSDEVCNLMLSIYQI